MTDPVARSDELDAKLLKTPIIKTLVAFGETNRRLIKWVAVSVAFDIGLSIALGILALRAADTANTAKEAAAQANSAATQARLQCLAGNKTRHDQLQLWDFILSLPPTPGLSAQVRKQQDIERRSFKVYVKKVFAPRDCAHPLAQTAGPLPTETPTAGQSSDSPQAQPSPFTITKTYFIGPQARPTPRQTSTEDEPSSSPSASPSSSPTTIVQVCVSKICIPPHPSLFMIGVV